MANVIHNLDIVIAKQSLILKNRIYCIYIVYRSEKEFVLTYS